MDKEEILKASRTEHKNRDLAELEVLSQAGTCAARVGSLVCCLVTLLSSALTHMMLYSPWVIYFSMMGTQWLVRYGKLRRRSDLVLAVSLLIMAALALLGLVLRLLEVRA